MTNGAGLCSPPFKRQFNFDYMKRVIKFRAFNKVSEIMYLPEATPGNYNHYFQIGTEGFWLYNKDGQLICSTEKSDVLMQFTGLKDKNWKEIYEGDIIKAADRLFTVVFNDGCFYTVRGLNRFLLGEWPMEGIELIGNIYEHPHLLTPSQKGDVNISHES